MDGFLKVSKIILIVITQAAVMSIVFPLALGARLNYTTVVIATGIALLSELHKFYIAHEGMTLVSRSEFQRYMLMTFLIQRNLIEDFQAFSTKKMASFGSHLHR